MFLASGEPEKDTVSAMTVCRVDVMGSDLGSGIWDLGSGESEEGLRNDCM